MTDMAQELLHRLYNLHDGNQRSGMSLSTDSSMLITSLKEEREFGVVNTDSQRGLQGTTPILQARYFLETLPNSPLIYRDRWYLLHLHIYQGNTFKL